MFAQIELVHFLHIVTHHDADKVLERSLLRIPAQLGLSLCRIAEKLIDLCRTEVLRIDLNQHLASLFVVALLIDPFAAPFQLYANLTESQRSELADRVVLARGNDEVVGLRLLQDEPHALDVVLGIAPS